VPLKLKLAELEPLGSLGWLVIEVSGAVVSTFQLKLVAPLWLPAASLALTSKLCVPSTTVYVFGLVQALKPPPSSWQRKLTPPSLPEEPKLALVELVGSLGCESIVGAGGALV